MTLFRPLTPGDIPGALHLSTQAGWNQLAADWNRLVTLWPETCMGGIEAGRLVVSGTLATFGAEVRPPIAWIGMILVEEDQRGKGLGTAMMKLLLDAARSRQVRAVGLDATDMGKPVYEKLGFVTHSIVNRWMSGSGPRPGSVGVGLLPTRPFTPELWPAADLLDQHAVGVSRQSLFRRLLTEEGAAARVVMEHGRVTAFGFARDGRTARYIGPIVAGNPAAASAMFAGLFPEDRQAVRTLIDVPEHSPLCEILRNAGFSVQRRLTRMLLPLDGTPPQSLMSEMVYAGAGFELG